MQPEEELKEWERLRLKGQEVCPICGEKRKDHYSGGWMNCAQIISISEWREKLKAKGFSICLEMCRGISNTMAKNKCDFRRAIGELEKASAFVLIGKMFFFKIEFVDGWIKKD